MNMGRGERKQIELLQNLEKELIVCLAPLLLTSDKTSLAKTVVDQIQRASRNVGLESLSSRFAQKPDTESKLLADLLKNLSDGQLIAWIDKNPLALASLARRYL